MAGSNDTDIFGLTKKSQNSTHISHPSMVGITLPGSNNGEIILCQSVQVDYQRQAQPIYELGSENVYIAVQGATGSVSLNRAINKETAALVPYKGTGCVEGEANLIIKTTKRDKSKCHADMGEITCEGATLTRVGFQAQAGQAIITDSAEYVVGAVKVGSGSGGSGGNSGIPAGGTPGGQGGPLGNPSIH